MAFVKYIYKLIQGRYSLLAWRTLHVSTVDTWWIHFELKIMSLNLRPTLRFCRYWENGECFICISCVFNNVPRVLVMFGGSLTREKDWLDNISALAFPRFAKIAAS